jgi:hypothetical protein
VNIQGKTYSLYGDLPGTEHYYETIKDLTDLLLRRCPDEKRLLSHIQKAGGQLYILSRLSRGDVDLSLISFIRGSLQGPLSGFTKKTGRHLWTMTPFQRLDGVLRTRERQYHLHMIEVELTNRINKEAFKEQEYKFALLAHCLRDFRPECRAVQGEIESICRGCSPECLIHLGGLLLKKYGVHPYISVTMDLGKLFGKLKSEHSELGALGIACLPELAGGMRLCNRWGIPAVGIPLDANRCERWMKQAEETTFSLKELDELLC